MSMNSENTSKARVAQAFVRDLASILVPQSSTNSWDDADIAARSNLASAALWLSCYDENRLDVDDFFASFKSSFKNETNVSRRDVVFNERLSKGDTWNNQVGLALESKAKDINCNVEVDTEGSSPRPGAPHDDAMKNAVVDLKAIILVHNAEKVTQEKVAKRKIMLNAGLMDSSTQLISIDKLQDNTPFIALDFLLPFIEKELIAEIADLNKEAHCEENVNIIFGKPTFIGGTYDTTEATYSRSNAPIAKNGAGCCLKAINCFHIKFNDTKVYENVDDMVYDCAKRIINGDHRPKENSEEIDNKLRSCKAPKQHRRNVVILA